MKISKGGIYIRFLKRPLDFISSLISIIILSPIMIIVAIFVRIKLGYPVIFKQKRPGKNCRIFILYKFRTMTNKKDESGNLLPDSERLTNFGKFLRSTSLDELPSLFNILLGHMSFIGPRPLAVIYLPYYTEEENLRHSVRPGLTGLAQVNGRNALSWEERFRYDIEYINRITLLKDIKIMLQTFLRVLQRKDVVIRGTNGIVDFNTYRESQKAIENQIK